MTDEARPGPGGDAEGPREDRVLPLPPAWRTRFVLRPRRAPRRHPPDRQGAAERRCTEQGDGARAPRGRADPRGIAARRRRTQRNRIAGGRRHLHSVRRLDPLPPDPRRVPRRGRPAVPVLRAGRIVRAIGRRRPPAAARGTTGVARDPRGCRGRHAPHDPDVPRRDVRDDGSGHAPRGVPERIPRRPGRSVRPPRRSGRASGAHAADRGLRARDVRAARTPRLSSPPHRAEPLRRAVETRRDDVPDGCRRCGPRPRTEGRGRGQPEPRRREGLGHVRGARASPHEHPRRSRHRARGAAPRERPRRCRGDDLREEGLMDEVRLGRASVHILPVVRGLPSETSTVDDAIRTTNPDVVALSIGPEELQALRVYRGGPLEPENFEEEIYVAGLSAWEPPLKPPPCFTEAIRIAETRGTRLEAIDMDEVTYTENYVDCVSGLEVVFQGRLERRLKKKQFYATTPRDFVIEWDSEVNGPPGFAQLQARREAHMAARLREIAVSGGSVLAVIEVERVKGVLAGLRG